MLWKKLPLQKLPAVIFWDFDYLRFGIKNVYLNKSLNGTHPIGTEIGTHSNWIEMGTKKKLGIKIHGIKTNE